MESSSIRVGIVGCGRVAEHHLRFLSELAGIQVIALSDPDLTRAQTLAERYRVPKTFTSLEQMLESTGLDALHVLSPPVLHYAQAAAGLDAGLHVLVEKPAALSSNEVKDLYERAARKNVRLCPDFIQLFHPAVEKITELVASCRFGSVIHVESFMGVEAALPELREWSGTHWSFNLPGGVLHNYITHPLYLTLNWIGAPRSINVLPRSYGVLPHGLTDHLEITIEGERATASVAVSFAMAQAPFSLKLYCEKGSLLVNFDTMSLVVQSNSRLPRSARRLFHNLNEAQQLTSATIRTVWGALRKTVVPYQGLRTILRRFYDSIESGAPLPIPESLVIHTALAEDFIAAHSGKVHLALEDSKRAVTTSSSKPRVLVTGATGFVGKVLVLKLLDEGFQVRAYVRPLSDSRWLENSDVEIVYGDVREPEPLRRAMQGVESIIHLAAGVRGSRQFACSSCTTGTENIAALARESGINRIVYVSSMAIHDFLAMKDGECIRENSPLEPHPELRSTYAQAKRGAEEIAISHIRDNDPSWTIVRPSLIFGPGWNPISAVGFRVGGQIFSLGSRRKQLRLVHVDDACDALIAILRSKESKGQILNLSHPDAITTGECVQLLVRKRDERLRIFYIPGSLLLAVGAVAELALKTFRLPLFLNRRRVAYLVRSNPVDGAALDSLGIWKPTASLREQLERAVFANQPIRYASLTPEMIPSSLSVTAPRKEVSTQ